MGTLFFFLSIIVIPGFPSGALVGRWAILAIASAVIFFTIELSWWAWALLGYLAVMCAFAPVGYEAVNLYCHAVMLVLFYAYAKGVMPAESKLSARSTRTTDAKPDLLRRIAVGVGLGFAVNSIVVIGQHYLHWQFIPEITPGSGLYFNRNIASEGAAMALALVVGYRLWWLVPGILPTLAFGSRTPALALGIAGAIALWRRSKIVAAIAVICPCALAVLWLQTQGDNSITAGVLDTLKERLGTWYDGAHGFTIFGQGLGSWNVNFPLYQRHTNALELRWENAHNDAVQVVFELGIVGAGLLAAGLWRLCCAPRNPAFYALVVFVVESLLGFPLYEPFTGALAAVCAGYLFRDGDPLRRQLAGIGLRIWAWLANRRPSALLQRCAALSTKPRQTFGWRLRHHLAPRLQTHGPDRQGVAL